MCQRVVSAPLLPRPFGKDRFVSSDVGTERDESGVGRELRTCVHSPPSCLVLRRPMFLVFSRSQSSGVPCDAGSGGCFSFNFCSPCFFFVPLSSSCVWLAGDTGGERGGCGTPDTLAGCLLLISPSPSVRSLGRPRRYVGRWRRATDGSGVRVRTFGGSAVPRKLWHRRVGNERRDQFLARSLTYSMSERDFSGLLSLVTFSSFPPFCFLNSPSFCFGRI